MFTLPKNLINEKINIIGIDPGSSNLGYCCLSVNALTNEIISTKAKTLKADSLSEYNINTANIFSPRFARLLGLKKVLSKLFLEDNPSVIACEGAFFNPRRPNAFEALVEVILTIKFAVIRFDNRIPLTKIEPRLAKKNMQTNGLEKDDMKQALIFKKNIFKLSEDEINSYDEHSVDACSIAYSAYLLFNK